MNHKRNRHSGHMNAYKAGIVDSGEPVVIRSTLYFERKLPRKVKLPNGKVGVYMVTQRVRALKHDETIED